MFFGNSTNIVNCERYSSRAKPPYHRRLGKHRLPPALKAVYLSVMDQSAIDKGNNSVRDFVLYIIWESDTIVYQRHGNATKLHTYVWQTLRACIYYAYCMWRERKKNRYFYYLHVNILVFAVASMAAEGELHGNWQRIHFV